MIAIDNYKVFNLESAIKGMRNPMNSWSNSDSCYINNDFIIGIKDKILARKLCLLGSDHRKFMRQIFVSMDITAPLYWWKQFDSYKVNVSCNSSSTMHKIHNQKITEDLFGCDNMDDDAQIFFKQLVDYLELQRLTFLETNDKKYWYNIISLLPSNYLQLRTCTLSYENLFNIFHSRRNHKLCEWREFCDWITRLPYANDFILLDNETKSESTKS